MANEGAALEASHANRMHLILQQAGQDLQQKGYTEVQVKAACKWALKRAQNMARPLRPGIKLAAQEDFLQHYFTSGLIEQWIAGMRTSMLEKTPA